MATITSLGVGSGLDLSSIVSGLMAVEKQPLTALKTKQSTVESRISALGTLKSALASLQTAAGNLVPGISRCSTIALVRLSAMDQVSEVSIASS